MNTVIIFIALLLAVYFDAYNDARIDKTGKRSHWSEAAIILVWFSAIFSAFQGTCIDWYEFGVFYLIARLGWFNPIYNWTRGLPFAYAGNTDGIFDKWFRKAAPGLRASFHIIFGASAILMMLNRMFNCL